LLIPLGAKAAVRSNLLVADKMTEAADDCEVRAVELEGLLEESRKVIGGYLCDFMRGLPR
jgi:hypothetical protein